MFIVWIIIGLSLLLAMLYLALSKKTAFGIRIAALIALGIMVLSVIVGLVFIFFGGVTVTNGQIIPDSDIPANPPRAADNSFAIIALIVFLLALFVLVLILSLREHRMKNQA